MKTNFVKAALLAASLLVQTGVQCHPMYFTHRGGVSLYRMAIRGTAFAGGLGTLGFGYANHVNKKELEETKKKLNAKIKAIDELGVWARGSLHSRGEDKAYCTEDLVYKVLKLKDHPGDQELVEWMERRKAHRYFSGIKQ